MVVLSFCIGNYEMDTDLDCRQVSLTQNQTMVPVTLGTIGLPLVVCGGIRFFKMFLLGVKV